MKNGWVWSFLLYWLAAVALRPLSAQEKNGGDDSNEVHCLFVADQAVREKLESHPGATFSSAEIKDLTEGDKKRRERTRQIIDAGGLKTAKDYHDAAFIFQHGDTPEDYLLAHILASAGVAKGDLESRWIAAATLDRYLQSIKQKQVFGTQYYESGNDPYTQEPYDRKLLTDDLRKTFCVRSQAEQEKALASFNQHVPPPESDPCAAEAGAKQGTRIGSIEFFGYAGMDLKPVQAALPIHVGDPFTISDGTINIYLEAKENIKQAVTRVTGREPTDIGFVCCNRDGNFFLFIGLQGSSSKAFPYNPVPTGSVRLPAEAIELYDQDMTALGEAVASGNAGEDDSQGYMLATEPKERALNLKMREYALHHEDVIREALKSSSDVKSRDVASMLLGYAKQSQRQIDDLVAASRDPDSGVRNNAVRALAVLAASSRDVAAKIPATYFIEMLNSGDWTDRNKSIALLTTLTASRPPQLLAQLRSHALDALIEMACWHTPYAIEPRMILGRIAGIDDKRLQDLTASDPEEVIIAAVKGK